MLNYLVIQVTFTDGNVIDFKVKTFPKIEGNLMLAQTTEGEKLIFNFQNIQYIKVN